MQRAATGLATVCAGLAARGLRVARPAARRGRQQRRRRVVRRCPPSGSWRSGGCGAAGRPGARARAGRAAPRRRPGHGASRRDRRPDEPTSWWTASSASAVAAACATVRQPSSAACLGTPSSSRSTCRAGWTRRPARWRAWPSAPTSPSPSAPSSLVSSSIPGPSTPASSSWSTSGSTSRPPTSRRCRSPTSPACCREPTAHSDKYRRGVVGVAAGSAQYTGAAVLCVGGAVHGGAGMVRYVGDDEPTSLVRARWPQVVVGEGRVQAWAVGSGGGGDAAGRLESAADDGVPMVVDADALAGVADRPGRSRREVPMLLTPHAGELARLVGADRADVEARRLHHARRAARDLDAVVLLKGLHDGRRPAGRPGARQPDGHAGAGDGRVGGRAGRPRRCPAGRRAGPVRRRLGRGLAARPGRPPRRSRRRSGLGDATSWTRCRRPSRRCRTADGKLTG